MNELQRNISSSLRKIMSRFVSGSNLIRVQDLLDNNEFELLFRRKLYVTNTEVHKNITDEIINELSDDKTLLKKIVLSDPGIGKSTLTFYLFNIIYKSFTNSITNYCPIHIDLAEYTGDNSFGTKEWTKSYLSSLIGDSTYIWGTSENKDGNVIIPLFILDSLDEYLANCTLIEAKSELNKYIFAEANIIGCRTQFYEYYIASSNKTFSKNFDKFVLIEWDDRYLERYTRWYFDKFFASRSISTGDLIARLKHSRDLWIMCRVPIRYNMILEILATKNMNFSLVSRLTSIYHNYIIMTIKHESSRSGSILSFDNKLKSLKIIAWNFYDERQIGDGLAKIRFSIENIEKLISEMPFIKNNYTNINEVALDLVKSSVLIEDFNDEYSDSYTSLKFSHKSIQEYFVAKFIYDSIVCDDSAEKISDIYRSFIAQEIDQFFKDYLEVINQDLDKLEIASKNYVEAIKINYPCIDDDDILVSRKRIARNQLGYSLGHLKTVESKGFLKHLLEIENDEFVRRSIIIGQAFGEHSNQISEYVDMLRSVPRSESNSINVGFQLSYFGDQPFDVFKPQFDQGKPKCSNTIRKLIHVISEEKNKGSWQIDLYTILYLYFHRPASKRNCEETLREHISEFERAIQFFNLDPECKGWIETKTAMELVQKLKKQTNPNQSK